MNRFLLQYRATPHLTTGRSPAEMLYNKKIRTKVPCFPTHQESEEQKKIREHHDKRKGSQKKYFDKRSKAANKNIEIGDEVLVKHTKSTTKPQFNPTPFTVISVQGNRVTATDENKYATRDKNQLKKLHIRPNSLKPS